MSWFRDIAVAGAAGLDRDEALRLLAERGLPSERLSVLDAGETVGDSVDYGDGRVRIEDVHAFEFSRLPVVLYFGGGQMVPGEMGGVLSRAMSSGSLVIDAGGSLPAHAAPLLTPGIGRPERQGFPERGLVVVADATTGQMLSVLEPIHAAFGLTRVDALVCCPVSSTGGRPAVDALARQSAQALNGCGIGESGALPAAFNILPRNGEIDTDEPSVREARRTRWLCEALGTETLDVRFTEIVVPVFYGCSIGLHLDLRGPVGLQEVREVLRGAPAVVLCEGRRAGGGPSVAVECVDDDRVFVGQLRRQGAESHGLALWLVADNVRRGPALDAVRIAEAVSRQAPGADLSAAGITR